MASPDIVRHILNMGKGEEGALHDGAHQLLALKEWGSVTRFSHTRKKKKKKKKKETKPQIHFSE